MPGPPLDPEVAPLRGGAGSHEAPSTSGRGASPAPAARSPHARLVRVATLVLTASATVSGLALWVRTGRVIEDLPVGVHASASAHVAVAAPVVTAKAGAGDADHPAAPPFHTAAAEWWAAMVAPYPGAARDEAFKALREQDAAEATAAAARFAAIDAAAAAAATSAAAKPLAPYTGNPADYALTPSLLASLAGPPPSSPSTPPPPPPFITITWCNAAFVPFALNWAAHARAVGISPFLVGASDEEALKQLVAAGLPTFAMPRLVGKAAGLTQTSPKDLGWGSPAFHALGREKAATAAAVTGSGHDVLLTDTDLVFLRDPAPYFGRFPDAALLTSSDGLHRTTVPNPAPKATPPPADASGLAVAIAALSIPGAGDGLEPWPAALDGSDGNIGIMLWRAHSHPVAVAWRDALLAEPGAWDQDVFNDLLRAGDGGAAGAVTVTAAAGAAENKTLADGAVAPPPVGSAVAAAAGDEVEPGPVPSPGLFRTFGRAAPTPAASLAGVLPVDTFASGHTHFVQRLSERTGQAPFAVHTTFQFSGTVGKRHRLRERWLWAVDEGDHFAPAGGLVTLGALEEADPAVARLLGQAAGAGGPSLDTHFALVNAQLVAFRAGLALATALNRTLVLPRFWCGVDRWWASHGGVIPGSTLPARLPFRCPADHLLDLAAMADGSLDVGSYGPQVPYREAGLTANPRFPPGHRVPGVRGTVAVVVVEGGGKGDSHTTRLPSALDDDALRAALAPFSSTPVLHFPNPASVFGGFRNPAAAARFSRRVSISTDLWCCTSPPGPPKPVWYDAQTDEDHTDRHGVAWKAGAWVARGA